MITFKKFGKTASISNRDWKSLRARFNPHNATFESGRGKYVIAKKCAICARVKFCEKCPLGVFSKDSHGCFILIEHLVPDIKFNTSMISYISWVKKNDRLAREQLYKLQDMMDKIEASQGGKE